MSHGSNKSEVRGGLTNVPQVDGWPWKHSDVNWVGKMRMQIQRIRRGRIRIHISSTIKASRRCFGSMRTLRVRCIIKNSKPMENFIEHLLFHAYASLACGIVSYDHILEWDIRLWKKCSTLTRKCCRAGVFLFSVKVFLFWVFINSFGFFLQICRFKQYIN